MSVSKEYENYENRQRGARTRSNNENSGQTELSRFAVDQKSRYERVFKLGIPRSPLRDLLDATDGGARRARAQNISSDFAAIEANMARTRRLDTTMPSRSAQASGFSYMRDGLKADLYEERGALSGLLDFADGPARRGFLLFAALIIIVGGASLAANSVSRRATLKPAETAAIEREAKMAKPPAEKPAEAERPAQVDSLLGPLAPPGAPELPADVSREQANMRLNDAIRRDTAAIFGPAAISPTPEKATPAPTAPGAGPDRTGSLGYPAAALAEFEANPKKPSDDVQTLDPEPTPESAKVSGGGKESEASEDTIRANCFVKVDGRVLVSRSCRVLRTKAKRVTFQLTEKPVTIAFDHGRTWMATLGSQDLGRVFKRGSCWGSRRVYICQHDK